MQQLFLQMVVATPPSNDFLDGQVIAALLGLIGVAITAGFGYAGIIKQRQWRIQAENELHLQAAALSFGDFIHEWEAIHEDLAQLMEETCIDRFLLLRAWNGEVDPRWTTAIWQVHQGVHKPVSYVHFELDLDYLMRLRQAIDIPGGVAFSTSEINGDSAIRAIYESEGVKSAAWFFLAKHVIPDRPGTALTYCSFASSQREQLLPETVVRCRLIADRLRGVADNFDT